VGKQRGHWLQLLGHGKRVGSEGQEGHGGPTQRPCGGVNKTNMTGQRMSGNDVSVMIIKLYDSSSWACKANVNVPFALEGGGLRWGERVVLGGLQGEYQALCKCKCESAFTLHWAFGEAMKQDFTRARLQEETLIKAFVGGRMSCGSSFAETLKSSIRSSKPAELWP